MLFVFGDSYSDSGAGFVYADGPTAVVYLARGLGIPFTHARDADRAGKGLNFAVSGARTGADEGAKLGPAVMGRGVWTQVEDFAERVHAGEVKFDPAHTLFFIAAGLNDVRVPTETSVANLRNEIRLLYAAGARHFRVALLPTKIAGFAVTARRLNPAIAGIPTSLRLEGATIELSHWGEYFDAVMDNPRAYGILNTTDSCAGRASIGVKPVEKGDPATYYFYYDAHPSTAVHRAVGEMMLREEKGLKD